MNYGIKIAKGKYIVILHSGDIFFKNTLKFISENILDYDAISGNVLFTTQGKVSRYWDYKTEKLNKFTLKVAHTALVVKCY